MTTILSPKILLVGAGYMAIEYAKVLKALKKPFITVGRSEKTAAAFEQATGLSAARGGVANWLKNNAGKTPPMAIVAVDEEQLGLVACLLIKNRVKTILLEKPGGLNAADLKKTESLASQAGAKVFIAYNRRFYASTIKAKELIKKDGGVMSFTFDFTERSHLIEKSDKSMAVKKEWLLANSSHVIDLAFFLGGQPKKMNSYSVGDLNWHPSASIYTGAGLSKKKALFSYHANWESAGRWGVEIMTAKHKLIFRPLEKLQIQKNGETEIKEIELDNRLDLEFKPGLYRLVKSFLTSQENLPTLNEQVKNMKYYEIINKSGQLPHHA